MKSQFCVKMLKELYGSLEKGLSVSRKSKVQDDIIRYQNEVILFRLRLLQIKQHLMTIDLTELQVFEGFELFDLPALNELYARLEHQNKEDQNTTKQLQRKTIKLQKKVIKLIDCFGQQYFVNYSNVIKRQSAQAEENAPKLTYFNPESRGLYLWGANHFESLDQAELFAVCKNKRIELILLSVNDSMLDEGDELGRFIRRAHKYNILVGALKGFNHDNVLPRKRQKAINRLKKIKAYNYHHLAEDQFDVVHIDIEPYADPVLKTVKNTAKYIRRLKELLLLQLELLEKSKSLLEGIALIGADFPYRYDVRSSSNELRELTVRYSGSEKPVSHHILDIMDYACVMAYGDTKQKCIRFAEEHIRHASKARCPLLVSLNCSDRSLATRSESSLYDQGKIGFENAIDSVEARFLGNIAFGGVVIHDYRSYHSLLDAGGSE